MQHPDGMKGAQPKGGGKGGKADKDKGKGKGMGQGKGICRRFQTGSCPNSRDTCKYKHIIATDPAEKDFLKTLSEGQQSRSRSPSPADAQRPCRQFAETGACTFGERCRYSHETAAPKAKAKGQGRKPKGDF